MKRLGVIANTTKPRASAVLATLKDMAHALQLQLFTTSETARLLPDAVLIEDDSGFDAVDAVLALGGDGTMLAAIRRLNNLNTPLIGVNIGSLGFMTSVSEVDMERALRCLRDETFIVSERSVAQCEVQSDGGDRECFCALNDVVVSSSPSSRVVRLEVCANDSLVTTYVCDGLIVSTPTGSTGHSLSAGGPIMLPETHAFVVSVICPHTLSSRPLVLPDNTTISIRVADATHPLRLSIDGQIGRILECHDSVDIRRFKRNVRFLHLPDYDYFSVLRRKLNWSGSTTTGNDSSASEG